MSSFQGFPPEAFTFFVGLEKDNSRAYWEDNKAVWENKIHQPMLDFLDAFEGEFPPFRLFRPNRDVRFSKDKSPYKLWTGAASENSGKGSLGLYIRLSSSGLMAAYGAYIMERDQLERLRAAIDHDLYGPQFEEIVRRLAASSLPVTSGSEAPLKTVPQGYAKDHPRADFLRWKGVVAIKEFDMSEKWLHTSQAVDKVKAVWHTAEPLKIWLDSHVGPSQEAPARVGTRSR